MFLKHFQWINKLLMESFLRYLRLPGSNLWYKIPVLLPTYHQVIWKISAYIILDYSKLIFLQTLPKRIWVTGKWFPKMPKCRAVFPFTLVSLILIKFEKFNKIFFKFSLCPYKQECQSQIRSTLVSDVSFWLFLIDFVDPDFTVLAFLGLVVRFSSRFEFQVGHSN